MPINKSNKLRCVRVSDEEEAWTSGRQRKGRKIEIFVMVENWTCPCGFDITEQNKKLFNMKVRLHKKTCKESPATHKCKGK